MGECSLVSLLRRSLRRSFRRSLRRETDVHSFSTVGECGLDYDRLHLCPKDVQLRHFPPQLELASRFDLPLFLHSRAAHRDFVDIVKAHGKPLRGVVHSHSESLEQALECIELGFFIGIK